MRAGGCTLQQALTPEAAAVVMQAVSLATRRGHAQVTPLHVASTMLSSPSGLLRASCLQSHSHPLQCKALELCFNVALNRLPASSSSAPLLAPHDHHRHHAPSLSNALVAAFKRAQAHQRRGSIESQQQPLLAAKIEVEQLIISILDDPSVSRVMREAGFSSTQVKSNVEQALSLDICSPSHPPSTKTRPAEAAASLPPTPAGARAPAEDVASVLDCLAGRRRKSVVVVGECLASAEGVVRGVMERVDRGECPELLRGAQFVNLPILSFAHLSADQVERKVGELRFLAKSRGRASVLYLGDLRCAMEYRTACAADRSRSFYCPVEHVIVEIGRLASGEAGGGGGGDGGRFWIMAIATFRTYMRCRSGYPSLRSLWGLHPLTIPAGGFNLTLGLGIDNSNMQIPPPGEGGGSGGDRSSLGSSILPSWIKNADAEDHDDVLQIRDVWKKWNSVCESSLAQQRTFRSACKCHCCAGPGRAQEPWAPAVCKEHHFFGSGSESDETHAPPDPSESSQKPMPASTASSDTMQMDYRQRFMELNAENHRILCNALESKVPWQKDIIPGIATAVLQCRSGMRRRNAPSSSRRGKEDAWLLFRGCDTVGKRSVARELARLIFGSSSSCVSVGLGAHRDDSADSANDVPRKRPRTAETCRSYLDKFFDAARENPHRVFVLEDVEAADPPSRLGIKDAMDVGALRRSDGEEVVDVEDAVVIFDVEAAEAGSSLVISPQAMNGGGEDDEEEDVIGSPCVSLDLNLSAEEENEDGLLESVDRIFFFSSRNL